MKDKPTDILACIENIQVNIAKIKGSGHWDDDISKSLADMVANKIPISSNNPNFTSKNIEGCLNELFQNADNARKTISNVIGSPLSATQTLEYQAQLIRTMKELFVKNLKTHNINANANDSLNSLIYRVADINDGVKSFKHNRQVLEQVDETFEHHDPYTNAHDDYNTLHTFIVYETKESCNGFIFTSADKDYDYIAQTSFSGGGRETFGYGRYYIKDGFGNKIELLNAYHAYNEKGKISGHGSMKNMMVICCNIDSSFYWKYEGYSHFDGVKNNKYDFSTDDQKLNLSKGFTIYIDTSTSRGTTKFHRYKCNLTLL